VDGLQIRSAATCGTQRIAGVVHDLLIFLWCFWGGIIFFSLFLARKEEVPGAR
jgi:hypothetical protein